MDDTRTRQKSYEMARKAEITEKLMSPQVLTSPLRSLVDTYTANQPSG